MCGVPGWVRHGPLLVGMSGGGGSARLSITVGRRRHPGWGKHGPPLQEAPPADGGPAPEALLAAAERLLDGAAAGRPARLLMHARHAVAKELLFSGRPDAALAQLLVVAGKGWSVGGGAGALAVLSAWMLAGGG